MISAMPLKAAATSATHPHATMAMHARPTTTAQMGAAQRQPF